MTSYSIVIIDKCTVVREMLQALFASTPGYSVISFPTYNEMVACGAASCEPDIALVGLSTHDSSERITIREMRRMWPSTKLVFTAARADKEMVQAALDVGARGYICDTVSTQGLLDVLAKVVDGSTAYDPSAMRVVLNEATKAHSWIGANPSTAVEPDGSDIERKHRE